MTMDMDDDMNKDMDLNHGYECDVIIVMEMAGVPFWIRWLECYVSLGILAIMQFRIR